MFVNCIPYEATVHLFVQNDSLKTLSSCCLSEGQFTIQVPCPGSHDYTHIPVLLQIPPQSSISISPHLIPMFVLPPSVPIWLHPDTYHVTHVIVHQIWRRKFVERHCGVSIFVRRQRWMTGCPREYWLRLRCLEGRGKR